MNDKQTNGTAPKGDKPFLTVLADSAGLGESPDFTEPVFTDPAAFTKDGFGETAPPYGPAYTPRPTVDRRLLAWYDRQIHAWEDGTWWESVSRGDKLGVVSAATGVICAVLLVALGVLAGLLTVVRALADIGGAAVSAIAKTRPGTITADGLSGYFTAHGAGLAATPADLLRIWLVVLAALLVMAFFFQSAGARIGWTLMGAATIAMTWIGTADAAARPTAAALTLLLWCVLSVLAFHGLGSRPDVIVLDPCGDRDHHRDQHDRNDRTGREGYGGWSEEGGTEL